MPINQLSQVPSHECAAASSALLALTSTQTESPSAAANRSTAQATRKRRRRSATQGGSNHSTDYDEEEPELVDAHEQSGLPDLDDVAAPVDPSEPYSVSSEPLRCCLAEKSCTAKRWRW